MYSLLSGKMKIVKESQLVEGGWKGCQGWKVRKCVFISKGRYRGETLEDICGKGLRRSGVMRSKLRSYMDIPRKLT